MRETLRRLLQTAWDRYGVPALRRYALPPLVAAWIRLSPLAWRIAPVVWRYALNVLLALDQLANTLLGGWPDETISSRMGRQPDCRVCRFVCRLLDLVDPRHCHKAVRAERADAQQPPENRS